MLQFPDWLTLMLDWNLVLIDVASAWVVVALPRYAQARLLARSNLYSAEALYAMGIDERLTVDPVKHTSFIGTLLAPALTSATSVPVVAWGKAFDTGSLGIRQPLLAVRLWIAPIIVYVLQACLLAAFMAVLAQIYLAGAPVAARAGQLCLRLALLNLLPLPLLDSGLSLAIYRGRPFAPRWLSFLNSAVILAILAAIGLLRDLDGWAVLAFFTLSQIFV